MLRRVALKTHLAMLSYVATYYLVNPLLDNLLEDFVVHKQAPGAPSKTMKLIDVLCNLPTSLSGIILCNWLELKNVVFLDSACCTSYQRPMVLDLFQSQEFVLKALLLEEAGHLRWMFKRSIKVLELCAFAEITDSSTASKYLQKFGCSVRSVHVASCSVHDAYLCGALSLLNYFDS